MTPKNLSGNQEMKKEIKFFSPTQTLNLAKKGEELRNTVRAPNDQNR
jgi:hypothetical protein